MWNLWQGGRQLARRRRGLMQGVRCTLTSFPRTSSLGPKRRGAISRDSPAVDRGTWFVDEPEERYHLNLRRYLPGTTSYLLAGTKVQGVLYTIARVRGSSWEGTSIDRSHCNVPYCFPPPKRLPEHSILQGTEMVICLVQELSLILAKTWEIYDLGIFPLLCSWFSAGILSTIND